MKENPQFRIVDFAKRPDALEYKLDLVVTEEAIKSFCRDCVFLQQDNTCKFSANDQTVYVSRGFCGWAKVDGQSGQMTEEGFSAYNS